MKNYIIQVAAVICLLVGVRLLLFKPKPMFDEDGRRIYRIALLTDQTPYHAAVNKGFYEAAAADSEYVYKITSFYSERCDYTAMHQAIQAVVHGAYDAVVTVGSRFSQVAATQLKRRSSDKPMIFVGVAKPVDVGCVDSEEHPGGLITGVRAGDDALDAHARVLHLVYPKVKSVLVIYDVVTDQGKQQAEVDAIEKFFVARGVTPLLRMVDTAGFVHLHLKHDFDKVDAVMVLEGSAAALDYPAIGKLCDRYQSVLCAGNAGDGVEEYAGIAFGPDPCYAGKRGFARMRGVLRGEIDPATTPVELIENARKIVLNPEACRRQGFEPDWAITSIIGHCSCIGEGEAK
jgi:ABC-type uncharacterized transport system substrate-binding protein